MVDETSIPSETNSKEIGLAIILMEDMGPQTEINLSSLDEISSMYLAVKGFTAFMSGFERDSFGPGKIRGILQIPESELYAVALDLNMRGTGFEDDPRLQKGRMGVVCLIADEEQLKLIRKYYTETETFLIEHLKIIISVNHLNDSFCKKLLDDYNTFIAKLDAKDKDSGKKESASLFEIDVLLSLPKEENLTARIIMESMSTSKQGLTLEEISKNSDRKQKKEQQIIDSLLEKGLIIAIPSPQRKDDLRYTAK